MYKPLSLVVDKASRDLESRTLPRIYSLVSRDEPRISAQHRGVIHTEVVQRDTWKLNLILEKEKPAPSLSSPRCIKSYRSDRVAIYDEVRDTFHAYSVTEAISQPGLSFQEAVDWVDDRLVLVGQGMGPKNFSIAMALILASWAVAILLILTAIRFIF